jgi:hypothetical protein
MDMSGLNNPILKLLSTKTMTSPSMIDLVVFMMTNAMDVVMIINKVEIKRSIRMFLQMLSSFF